MANLTQLRMLEDLDGFLPVDKPAGISFSTVVKTVKRKFNLVKLGHGGSLDTMASGLLVLLLNGANRYAGDIMGADREYEGVFRFGRTTDTGDAYGRETASGLARPSDLSRFRGDMFQTEPRFCSVRREGAADYEIADTGEHSPFLAHIYRFDVEEDGRFLLKASKNLIVRALATEMGATLESLRRVGIGRFSVSAAVPFDRLLDTEIGDFASCVMPLSEALR